MQKERKQRIIKNSIVNIDGVTVDRGDKNINWLKIAREKLKEREFKLLQQRGVAIDDVFIAAIMKFSDQNITTLKQHRFNANIPFRQLQANNLDIYEKKIRNRIISATSPLIQHAMSAITECLSQWKGYSPAKEVRDFREYFQGGRRWFDGRKIELLALHFWIPIMRLIDEFARSSFVGTLSCCDYFGLLIIISLFEGKFKPANTRVVWLVPAMSYSVFVSYATQKRKEHGKNTASGTSSKDVQQKYMHRVYTKYKFAKREFEAQLLRMYRYQMQRENAFPHHLHHNEYHQNNNNAFA